MLGLAKCLLNSFAFCLSYVTNASSVLSGVQTYQCLAAIGVRANIHLGGQTEFCPNYERKLFVTRPRQGEKNNNELLQSLFFDGRRVVPDERLLCYPTQNVSQQTTRC